MKKVRIAPPVSGVIKNYVICEMCVPDANLLFLLSFSPPSLPLSTLCILQFTVLPCQVRTVGSWWQWPGSTGRWGVLGREYGWLVGAEPCTSVEASGFSSEMQRNRPTGCLGRFWSAHHGLVIVPRIMFSSCVDSCLASCCPHAQLPLLFPSTFALGC